MAVSASVAKVKKQLGLSAKGREIAESADECHLREMQVCYGTISGGEKGLLSFPNLHLWEDYPLESNT